MSRSFRQLAAIVSDAETAEFVFRRETDHDVLRMTMLDGIIHRFLRNSIEVSGSIGIMNRNRAVGLDATGYMEQVFHFPGPLPQG